MSPAPRKMVLPDGEELEVHETFMGAEWRREDYVYLELMHREWLRPVNPPSQFLGGGPENSPSERAAIVLLFWAYFETRIHRLLAMALRDVAPQITNHLLKRNAVISDRLDKFYHELFDTTYFRDLNELGFGSMENHIKDIQDRRNRFTHGDPAAIDDALVMRVVENLALEHEAWISVFNRRATHPEAFVRREWRPRWGPSPP